MSVEVVVEEHATQAENETTMAVSDSERTEARSRRGLLGRRGRAWDAHEVADHLMACRAQMVQGLGRRSPWAGLDDDTLDSCFGHGAALIARVAASGARPEWRSVKDLERAQIAAFRHQALDHWKRVNAQSRQGDRSSVPFDPEQHTPHDAPLERLFEQPDLHAISRDLLAELPAGELLDFWREVLIGGATFKLAGDRLGLAKPQVMRCTRAGRTAFALYLDRRESGELCRDRGLDVIAARTQDPDPATTERAAAHLESCYACALIHDRKAGAFERGILSVAPIGLLARLAGRFGEVASAPSTRLSDVGTAGRLVAGGVAALTLAGSGVGIKAATSTSPKPSHRSAPHAPRPSTAAVSTPTAREPIRSPAHFLPSIGAHRPSGGSKPSGVATAATRHTRAPSAAKATSSSAPAAAEFSFERPPAPRTPAPAAPPSRTPSHTSPATSEFGTP